LLGAAASGALAIVAPRAVTAQGWSTSDQDARPEVRVYPPHGTWTASPLTEISFRGVTADELGAVRVTGSASGGHSGIMAAHADGDGVSYLPDARFEPGEVVTVRADVPLSPASDGGLTFGVVRPIARVTTPANRVTDQAEVDLHTFQSRPDLTPPVISITTRANGTADGYVFVTTKVPDGQNNLSILDNDGNLVWCDPARIDTDMHFDLRVQEYQGQPVLTWAEAATAVGYGFGHFVIADSNYQRIAEFQAGNGFPGADVHEFVLSHEGTALIILYHPVEWDLSPIGGSRYGPTMDNIVQEVEIETGRVLFEWHSLDHVDVDETYQPLDITSDNPFDYFHLNSANETPDGDIIISARHTFAIYLIDHATGEVRWRLNGRRSDFTMGEGTPFAWQHDARIHPNGEMTLFDNAESDQDLGPTAWSRGLVLALDHEAKTATLLREYIHPTEILSTSQGNMQTLPNGNVFIGWGSAPVFSEFTADGDLIFNGRFPQGSQSYRAYRHVWSGEPVDPPDIAVSRFGAVRRTVFASWNGATEVVSWRVLAGPAPTELYEVGSAPRDGFETAIPVETDAAYIAVEALAADGRILGASEAVKPGA
jgi:hypothetical protein